MKKFNLQSAKFNGGLRKGIRAFGRLSLNFAICTLLICGARAAKLCQATPPSWGLSVEGGGFVDLGTGCSNTVSTANCIGVYHKIRAFRTAAACSYGATTTAGEPGAAGSDGGTWCRLQNRKTWVCTAGTYLPAASERICGEFYSAISNKPDLIAIMFSAI
ncbi:MAG: hypothetical protein LBL46_01705 [Rickettsiales bacterium]|jgi:hypothetical protein|nr:hypothetical protein [Rickettsiales bacterium]